MAESTESAHPAGVVHEVDGIQEEDNRLPRWWLATFFVAIAFGYGYWEYFQVFHLGGTPLSDYREAVALEKKSHPPATVAPADSDQALIAMSKGGVEEGQAVFTTTCVACHGVSGEGKIGPNLTDAYWLHGGKPSDVLASVSHGYPLKGMPAWLRVVAEWNPVSAVASACRDLFGNPNPSMLVRAWPMQHPIEASLLWSLVLLVIFAPLASFLYRRRTTG